MGFQRAQYDDDEPTRNALINSTFYERYKEGVAEMIRVGDDAALQFRQELDDEWTG